MLLVINPTAEPGAAASLLAHVYGLAPDLDLLFLAGAELQQVAVGQYEVILNFSENISIMVASTIRLSGPRDHGDVLRDAPASGAAVLPLLGCSISAAAGATNGTLTLSWSDGRRLEIFDSSPNYESYTITHADGLIVV